MSLGVLNNINAIYASNNLNNTNNSLSKVLNQLSSGSKINSGADDAAGLSLVNGLQANSQALTQSQTNVSEGIGLLKVADGALSQVTNLLNRAVTLATEASNGTLNSSQDMAANQEYQSILSEINNIGATTTYNQQVVFNSNTDIYTGDSSTLGSSINSLNIRTLSSSNVGDSGGTMSYSNGQNNVFLNLSTSTSNAALTDTLSASGKSVLTLNYGVTGASGSMTTASAQIAVGTGTSYDNTVSGMIEAINNSGFGMTAALSTQAAAGVQGGGTQTGIQISGGMVSVGVDPNAASTSGILNASGITAGQLLTQGQTITVKQGTSTVGSLTINGTINTLQEVADAINNGTGTGVTGFALDVDTGARKVTASVITNGDGTQSLALSNNNSSYDTLAVTTTAGSNVTPTFAAAVTGNNAVTIGTATITAAGQTAVTGAAGAYTFGVSGTNAGADKLAVGGSITLSNSLASGTVSATFVVGSGVDGAGTYYTANHGGNTLTGLAAAVTASTLGATATVGAAGLTVTSNTTALYDNITASANTLTNANDTLALYNPTVGGAPTTGTNTVTVLDAGAGAAQSDVLTTATHITLTNGSGSLTFTAAAGQTWADLGLAIAGSNLGVNVAWNATAGGAGIGGLVLTSETTGVDTITVSLNNLEDNTLTANVVQDTAGGSMAAPGTAGNAGTYGTAVLQLNTGGTHTVIDDTNDTLTGQIVLNNGGLDYTFVMGAGVDNVGARTYYTGAGTVASLATKISGVAALGVTASAPGGGTGAIYLQSNTTGTTLAMVSGTLADANAIAATTAAVTGATSTTAANAVTTVNVASGSVATNDALGSGDITVQNTSAGTATTFTIGTGVDTGTHKFLAVGTTLSQLATAITGAGLGLSAQATTSGLTLTQSTGLGAGNIANVNSQIVATSTLADTTQGTFSSDQIDGFASASDTMQGTFNFSVGGVAKSLTVAAGTTVSQLVNQINTGTVGGTSSTYPYGVTASLVTGANGTASILLTSNTEGTAGNVTTPLGSTLRNTSTTADLSYTATEAYSKGLSSSGTNILYNSTAGQTSSAAATMVANHRAGSGTATISYTDGAGVSLLNTDLSNQSKAQSALTAINAAITAVAAMDGYIGAQINTLSAVSSVLSTQSENVISAQNAVQATDYAAAASAMSKYMILSQTGISALAQANSLQQEVTKLLQ